MALQPWSDGSLHRGSGLFLTAAASQGDVVLRVPTSLCLAVDYAAGLRLPPGAWPRLQRGVQKDAALPWDILLALALLDSLSGGGDAFWERYSNAVLPQPLDLTLPLCLPPRLLPQLQHAAIAAGAAAQQERLAGLFPGLGGSMSEDGPTWLQWGFGCVRSRAFRLADEHFAFVPLLDVANHAADPSCDFRLNAGEGCVELVAVKDLQPGQEATISYTGPAGMTNQRLMAQYGFVPGGNLADRLQFAALDGAGAAGIAEAGAAGRGSAGDAAMADDGAQAVLMSLDRMQACMGSDQRMASAMGGRDPFAYAALKSLPFAADEAAAAPLGRQLSLAEHLHAELEAEAAAWPTSLAQDGAVLQGWQEQGLGGGGGGLDARMVAVVEYRLRRKALVATCRQLLLDFMEGPPPGAA